MKLEILRDCVAIMSPARTSTTKRAKSNSTKQGKKSPKRLVPVISSLAQNSTEDCTKDMENTWNGLKVVKVMKWLL